MFHVARHPWKALGPLSIAVAIVLAWQLGIPSPAGAQSRQTLEGKKVLVLHSHESSAPAFLDTDRGLSSTLLSGGIRNLDLFFESMDLRRNPDPRHRRLLVEQMRAQYGHRKPDVIVTTYPEALEFVLKDCRDIFPGIPIVALYLSSSYELPEKGRLVVGHFPTFDISGTLEAALKLLPKTKYIYVVSGAHEVDKRLEEQVRRASGKWEGKLEFVYLSDFPLQGIVERVAHAPDDSVILTLVISHDVTGKNYNLPEVVRRLNQVSRVPIFGVMNTGLGSGIVGGSLINFERVGIRAGELVLDLLGGTTPPEGIPGFLTVPPVRMFDWRQLRRWNLSEAALPKDSIVVNREISLWDFRYYIVGILAFILGESALVVVLIVQRRRRKKAEETVRGSEAKYRALHESLMDGFALVDMEGRIREYNESFRKMTGYAPEELTHLTYDDLTPEEWHDLEQKIIEQQVLTRGYSEVYEKEYRRKDGTVLPVELRAFLLRDPAGLGAGMWAIVRDITERKRSEEERQRLAAAVEQTGEAVFITDAGFTVQYVNPAFTRLTGYSPDEIVGRDVSILRSEQEYVGRYESLRAALRSGQTVTDVYPIRRKDGRVSAMRVNASSIRDASGVITHHVIVCQDMSEQQKLEAQLRQAQKMEALGTLTGGIAHDFNNILAAITGFTELARGKVSGGDEAQRYLERVMDAGLRGRQLVQRMLAFSRRGEHVKEPLLLSNVLNETVRFLRASLPSTINIRVTMKSESGLILGDPVQLQQVLMNLCTNAAHAMRERGGTLDLELSDFSVSATGERSDGMNPGSYMKLVVHDAGVGIPADIIGRIFDPFFTTKQPDEGTGLGLSVVHGIVTGHGGYVTAESELGTGSAFTVYLPKAAQTVRKEPVLDLDVPTGHERVLFVDDEEALVEAGRKLLEELGYTVTATSRSAGALALFEADPDGFDLIVTDQTMPGMTGLELARVCLKVRPDMPFVLATGFSHDVDAASALEAGIRAFAMKPLTKPELARTVRKALDG